MSAVGSGCLGRPAGFVTFDSGGRKVAARINSGRMGLAFGSLARSEHGRLRAIPGGAVLSPKIIGISRRWRSR